MATLRPLHAIRYSPAAGSLENLTAPPYDVLSPAQRDAYASKNPHNVVWLTLPESEEGDRSKFVKYARSAARLAEWRKANILDLEKLPSFYRTYQDFQLEPGGKTYRRTALATLLKLEPYSNGVVLPHEQTFPKHKEDRLRLLEATRTHLESIFGLYEDETGALLKTIHEGKATESLTCRSEDGVLHTIEPISDPETCAAIVSMFKDKKVWIADGHHRYETALGFREAIGEKSELIAEDFILISLSSINDPGLVLLPTHRMVHAPEISNAAHLQKLEAYFTIQPAASGGISAQLASHPLGSFALAMPEGKNYILDLKTEVNIDSELAEVNCPELRRLDVTVLHSLILEKILGIKGLDPISYTRDESEALAYPNENGKFAYLMNPPSVNDMRTLATLGEKMPQKSTYYYPKLLSGAVMWSLNDF